MQKQICSKLKHSWTTFPLSQPPTGPPKRQRPTQRPFPSMVSWCSWHLSISEQWPVSQPTDLRSALLPSRPLAMSITFLTIKQVYFVLQTNQITHNTVGKNVWFFFCFHMTSSNSKIKARWVFFFFYIYSLYELKIYIFL